MRSWGLKTLCGLPRFPLLVSVRTRIHAQAPRNTFLTTWLFCLSPTELPACQSWNAAALCTPTWPSLDFPTGSLAFSEHLPSFVQLLEILRKALGLPQGIFSSKVRLQVELLNFFIFKFTGRHYFWIFFLLFSNSVLHTLKKGNVPKSNQSE